MFVLRRRLAVAAALVLALSACQPKTAGIDAPLDVYREADAIRSDSADRAVEVGEKDLDKTVARYAPKATMAWPGVQPVRGTAEIRSAYARSFRDPAFALTWTPEKVSVAKGGDLAWASGRFSLTRTDPATRQASTVKGLFVETFAKAQDGRWLVSTGVLAALPPAPADQ